MKLWSLAWNCRNRKGFRQSHNNPSGRRDSNSRHPPWQGGALPAELRPHVLHTTNERWSSFVGDTGFEPVTSSVSGKRATAAPIAQGIPLYYTATYSGSAMEVGTGFEPVCTDLQSVASPLGHPTVNTEQCNASGRRDSNSRHPPWQGGALPAELRPHELHFVPFAFPLR